MASLFSVLGSEKRRAILNLLRTREMHVSGVAKELGISVPVALKHVRKLEEAGLVARTRIGNTHLLRIAEGRAGRLEAIWSLESESVVLKAGKGAALSEVLSAVPEVVIKSSPRGSYIASVDGRGGYYIYELDGRLSDRPIDACRITCDTELEIKRLIPALGKKIKIKVE